MGDPRDVFDSWNRKWRTLWCWSQLYIGYKAAQAKGRLLSENERNEFWEKKHSYLAEMAWSNIAELRGWWVKVGQFLSTRSDLLPAQYITYLAKLQDMMPTSEFSVVKAIVEKELGRPLADVFSHFEPEALASASIAQVHKAKLQGSGKEVVVKIQHPGVDKTLRQDMLTLTQMTWAFGMLEKGLNVGPILEEWQKSASDELDFRVELRNQQRAREAVERSGIDVIIPKCYPELTTKRVLVMDYSDGFKITDLEKLRKYNVDTNALMDKICRSFAHQIHVDGMFNGDPHPGNILVQINPTTGEATPVLLDWGLVKSFSPLERIAFARAVYCVANVDVMGLVAAFEDMGFRFKSSSVIDPEVYMDALRVGFFRDSGEDTVSVNKSAISAARDSGMTKKNLMEKNPIDDWPKDIIFFIRVASLLHGLCLQLEARVPFLEVLVARAEQCLFERYTPPSPLVYIRYPPLRRGRARSRLEWRIFRFLLFLLREQQLLLGCQVAVFKDSKQIVDLCIGQMGPTNTRPVERSTLFPLMAVCNGLLATALLKLVYANPSDSVSLRSDTSDAGHLALDDPVCHWWDGFIRFGKEKITVRDVLSHRAGLHAALPNDLTLSSFTNYDTMISILEDAAPKHPYGTEGGRYAYLTSGWLFSEIIRGVTGERIDQYFHSEFIQRLGLTNEMFFPVPKALLGLSMLTERIDKNDGADCSAIPEEPRSPSPHAASQSSLSPNVVSNSVSEHSKGFGNCETPRPPKNVFSFQMNIDDLARVQRKEDLFAGSRSVTTSSSVTFSSSNALSQPFPSLTAPGLGSSAPDDTADGEKLENQKNGEATACVYPKIMINAAVTNDCQTVSPGNCSPAANGVTVTMSAGVPETKGDEWRTSLLESDPGRGGSEVNWRADECLKPNGELRVKSPRVYATGTNEGFMARFSSTSRAIGVAKIAAQEVQEKIEQARRTAAAAQAQTESTGSVPFPSKYLHKVPIRNNKLGAEFASTTDVRVTAIQLAKEKPHVLDPLIYDSRRLQDQVIPPTNCRATARAVAQFYAALASGRLVNYTLLEKASEIATVDDSLDALILTGGGSRLFGLGYQLYPCMKIYSECSEAETAHRTEIGAGLSAGENGEGASFPTTSERRRTVGFSNSITNPPVFSSSGGEQDTTAVVRGLGHGDMGGNIGLCFPELRLSIAILVNDVLTGPAASKQILAFILRCFGLEPCWDVPYSVNTFLNELQTVVTDRAPYQETLAAVNNEVYYNVQSIFTAQHVAESHSEL